MSDPSISRLWSRMVMPSGSMMTNVGSRYRCITFVVVKGDAKCSVLTQRDSRYMNMHNVRQCDASRGACAPQF